MAVVGAIFFFNFFNEKFVFSYIKYDKFWEVFPKKSSEWVHWYLSFHQYIYSLIHSLIIFGKKTFEQIHQIYNVTMNLRTESLKLRTFHFSKVSSLQKKNLLWQFNFKKNVTITFFMEFRKNSQNNLNDERCISIELFAMCNFTTLYCILLLVKSNYRAR